jgi:hypothetical protein
MKFLLVCAFLFAGSAFALPCDGTSLAACNKDLTKLHQKFKFAEFKALFERACAADQFRIDCKILTVDKSETLKTAFAMADKEGSLFVVNGSKFDKIYQYLPVKISPPPKSATAK